MPGISPKVIFTGWPSACVGVRLDLPRHAAIKANRKYLANYRDLLARSERELLPVVDVEN